MKHLKAFSVVEFPPDRLDTRSSVEAVPSHWISKDQSLCYWPRENVHLLVKSIKSVPTESWETFSIARIFSTHETYQEANKAANHFERCSDAEIDGDIEKSQRRKRVRVGSTSEVTLEVPNPSNNLPLSNLYGIQGPHFELVSAEAPSVNSFQNLPTTTSSHFSKELSLPTDLTPSTPTSSDVNRRKINLFPSQPHHPPSSLFRSCSVSEGSIQANLSQSSSAAVLGNEPLWSFNKPLGLDDEINQLSHRQTHRETDTPAPIPKPQEKTFESVVIRQLARLEANQKEMIKTLNTLVSNSRFTTSEVDREYFNSLPQFPISSEAELKSFENYLSSEVNLERAVKYFSQIGGLSKEQVVREILRRLLSREIALSISFTGKGKGNISFSQFSRVVLMIISATRRNKEASETEIRKICMDYFRFLRPSPSSSAPGSSA